MKARWALCAALGVAACSGGTLVRAPMDTSGGSDLASASDAGLATEDVSGRWTGPATFSNGRRSEVTLEVANASGVITGHASYTSFQCFAEWRLFESGAHEWTAEEYSVQGPSTCPRNGRVTLRVTGDSLEFDWRDSGGGSLAVHGSLRRARR